MSTWTAQWHPADHSVCVLLCGVLDERKVALRISFSQGNLFFFSQTLVPAESLLLALKGVSSAGTFFFMACGLLTHWYKRPLIPTEIVPAKILAISYAHTFILIFMSQSWTTSIRTQTELYHGICSWPFSLAVSTHFFRTGCQY